jgi:hypothetical protein
VPEANGQLFGEDCLWDSQGILEGPIKTPLLFQKLTISEREKGFEPSTSTLARLHSTTELFPQTDELDTRNLWLPSSCL